MALFPRSPSPRQMALYRAAFRYSHIGFLFGVLTGGGVLPGPVHRSEAMGPARIRPGPVHPGLRVGFLPVHPHDAGRGASQEGTRRRGSGGGWVPRVGKKIKDRTTKHTKKESRNNTKTEESPGDRFQAGSGPPDFLLSCYFVISFFRVFRSPALLMHPSHSTQPPPEQRHPILYFL